MMHLYLERFQHNKYGTFGELFLADDVMRCHLCYTLEPSAESKDLFGSAPIEDGDYKISLTMSPRFKRTLPLIHHPNRNGIRIHSGNTVQDTQGCILTGLYISKGSLCYSRLSLDHVIRVIKDLNLTQISISSLYGKVPDF